jgi:hypothetical protein
MKSSETPRSNKIGNMVAYLSPYGQCYHTYCIPRDPKSPAQQRLRAFFAWCARAWGLQLTEAQRQRWTAAALEVPSQPSLAQYSHLTGQRFWVKINQTLSGIGKAPVYDPPDPVVFGTNPVSGLSIVSDDAGGARLLLEAGPLTEEIMVFGQAPCSPGRSKPRDPCYLGLLGPAVNGLCDITSLYTARFGRPGPGRKVFIVTCQEKNGWKGPESVFRAIVPPAPLP